jgi:2-methylcitrate dehydratase PrpD
MTASVSRQLAQFVHQLRFEDLPPAVVDKTKALTLHFFAGALEGYPAEEVQELIRLAIEEESVARGGSSIVVSARVTKGSAAHVNAAIHHGAIEDTYRMITHPGKSIFPGALAVMEGEDSSGKEFITAIAAAYEVQERLTGDFAPSVMARGFHPGAVFGIFGPAIAAGKLMHLDEDQLSSTLGLCVSLASGNSEGTRSGGQMPREAASARNAMLAVLLARSGVKGGETTLEGESGFYHSFVGSNKGKLSYAWHGEKTTDPDLITAELGSRWEILDTVHKVYPTAGFNGPHVEVMARLCEAHDIKPEDVDRVDLVVNWFEAHEPRAIFPEGPTGPRRGSTHYFSAYGLVTRAYPAGRDWVGRTTSRQHEDPPEVLEMMQRTNLRGSKAQTLFGPRITVLMKNGKRYTAESTGREFMWDFAEEKQRIRERLPHLPIPNEQFDALVEAVTHLEEIEHASDLFRLTLAPATQPA